MTLDPSLLNAFAPAGKLRASINLGNPLLANRNAATGEVGGISVDLAREFATRLGVEAELVVFDTASKSVDAVTTEAADIGFFAIDPVRGAGIAFTAPYVLIEGLLQNQQGAISIKLRRIEALSFNTAAASSHDFR